MIAAKFLPDEPIVPDFMVSIGAPTKFTAYPPEPATPIQFLPPPPEGYGERLRQNKAVINRAFDDLKIIRERRVLFMAMAMAETNTMSPGERDWTKDGTTDGSINYSVLNINASFANAVGGYSLGMPVSTDMTPLLYEYYIVLMIEILNKAVDKWGVLPTLGFHRGGETTFTSVRPGVMDLADWERGRGYIKTYFASIKTIMLGIERIHSLMNDHRRVNIDVEHI